MDVAVMDIWEYISHNWVLIVLVLALVIYAVKTS